MSLKSETQLVEDKNPKTSINKGPAAEQDLCIGQSRSASSLNSKALCSSSTMSLFLASARWTNFLPLSILPGTYRIGAIPVFNQTPISWWSKRQMTTGTALSTSDAEFMASVAGAKATLTIYLCSLFRTWGSNETSDSNWKRQNCMH